MRRVLNPGVVKGIATADHQAWFEEPHFEDVNDAIDPNQTPIEGANVLVQPATPTGILGTPGITLWNGSFTFVSSLHSEKSAIQRHIEWAQGRVRSFWMPSWRTDFRIFNDAQPASRNIIYVQPVGFEFVYEADRYGIFIELRDRTYHVYRLVGYDPVTAFLTLNGALDTTFAAEDAVRVCLIRRVRFDQSSFKFGFVTDAVMSVSVNVHEVKGEGVFI